MNTTEDESTLYTNKITESEGTPPEYRTIFDTIDEGIRSLLSDKETLQRDNHNLKENNKELENETKKQNEHISTITDRINELTAENERLTLANHGYGQDIKKYKEEMETAYNIIKTRLDIKQMLKK